MSKLPRFFLVLTVLLLQFARAWSQEIREGGFKGILEQSYIQQIMAVPPLLPEPDTVEIMILGDVMMHARQLQYDYRGFLGKIEHRLAAPDVCIANMEFTLAGTPYTGYPSFSAPDGYADYIADCGVDVFLCANNHILDKGTRGLERTMEIYRQMEEDGRIYFTGISEDAGADSLGYPLMLKVKDMDIALVNFTYGTNSGGGHGWPKVNFMEKEDILKALERAGAKKADFIIVLPHWGEEYRLVHSAGQEEMARWLAENGADIIVGCHPHVVQDSSHIATSHGKKVPVFYSIGNLISNMSATDTRIGAILTVRIVHYSTGRLKMLEPEVEFTWCCLPGMLGDNYFTVPVAEYTGRRNEWRQTSDYDNMVATAERVAKKTGINVKYNDQENNNVRSN